MDRRTVAGDGTVDLLGAPSATLMGSEPIIAMSRHETRRKLALECGATDIVTERDDEGIARIEDMINGIEADSMLECVGTQESMVQAFRPIRRRGSVGYVGMPSRSRGRSCSFRISICRAVPRRCGAICPS